MLPLCRYLLHGGRLCQQASVNGSYYCRHHQHQKEVVAKAQPLPDPFGTHPPLAFVFPEDHAAIQTNLFLVIQALNDKMIDTRLANTYNRLFRSCELNLEKWDAANAKMKKGDVVERVILTPEGDEIGMPRLVLKDGERAPVHGEACPCPICAEEYRGAPQERHHAKCKCGLCQQPSNTSNVEASSAQNKNNLSSRPERSEVDAVSQAGDESGRLTSGSSNPIPAREMVTTPLDPIESMNQRFFAKEIREYEEKCGAEDRAAREAGLEPPRHEPWNTGMFLAEDKRRHEEEMAQIRKNQEIALEIMKRRFPHLTPEEPCLMSWGDEEDLMLAKKKEAANSH